MDIELEITKSGGIQMLHSDAVDLSQFGEVEVKRASHIEWSDGTLESEVQLNSKSVARMRTFYNGRTMVFDIIPKGWFVRSAATNRVLKSGFKTRAEALAWEKEYYSPGGQGWAELSGGR